MLRPYRGDAGEEFFEKLTPGQHYGCWYADDDVWHERVALWPVGRHRWATLSPDGDVDVEPLDRSDPEHGPTRLREADAAGTVNLPRGGLLYGFSAYPTEDELRARLREGRRAADDERGRDLVASVAPTTVWIGHGDERPVEEFLNGAGGTLVAHDGVGTVRRRLRGKQANPDEGAGDSPRAPTAVAGVAGGAGATAVGTSSAGGTTVPGPVATPFGEIWLCCEGGGEVEAGAEIDIKAGDWVIDGKHALIQRHGRRYRATLVKLVDVDAMAAELRQREQRTPCGDVNREALMDKLGHPGGTEAAGADGRASAAAPASGPAADRDGEDARTLWVDFDEHGERYKTWRNVIKESYTVAHPDAPLEGPNTVVHLGKHYDRHGGDPRRWLELWAKEKGIDPNDRIMHELRVLVDILYFSGCYDQLNIGALVGLEVCARRLQLCMDAYANPSRPSWEAAAFFTGQSSAADGVSPALRQHVARRAKDESEIINARVRARDFRGAASLHQQGGENVGDAVADGGLPAGGRSRGRGKGAGRNRGVAPAPQT